MRGNTFGKLFSFSSFGESHGPAMGVIVDGVPPGLDFSLDDLKADLAKRAPGQRGTTTRREPDHPHVLSGIFQGKTLGTPICVVIPNVDKRSKDYQPLKDEFRPGHADQTTIYKYGRRDHRGGGRASGRETVSRVVAGYFAGMILPKLIVKAFILELGPFSGMEKGEEGEDALGFFFGDKKEQVIAFLEDLKRKGDSVGGKVGISVDHCPQGLGEPVFDKLKADLAKGLLSIGGCVSFSFGLGQQMSQKSGLEVSSDRSFFGGIEGGISNGDQIYLEVVFKPPSTVGEKAKEGRHDPCIVPRAIPVVEAMVKAVLADHFLRQRAYENF